MCNSICRINRNLILYWLEDSCQVGILIQDQLIISISSTIRPFLKLIMRFWCRLKISTALGIRYQGHRTSLCIVSRIGHIKLSRRLLNATRKIFGLPGCSIVGAHITHTRLTVLTWNIDRDIAKNTPKCIFF